VLVYIQADDQVVAAAGYRIAKLLAWGRTFYVDDLIFLSTARRQGYGAALLDCDQFHLDSGVQRHDAHRLYLSRTKPKTANWWISFF
jgi:hypothetical protein